MAFKQNVKNRTNDINLKNNIAGVVYILGGILCAYLHNCVI
jgi:hypothetical protein